MPEFFNFTPETGVTETWDYDQMTGRAFVHHSSDLEAFFARNAQARNTGATDKGLMDNGREFHFYASIPPTVQIELRTKGIDIYSSDPAMQRRMFDEINANYPYLKMTDKVHR